MATCRCKSHPPRNNRVNHFIHTKEPVGYPNTSSICGNAVCQNPGLVWLTDNEEYLYQNNNQRAFGLDTGRIKVKVV